MIKIIDKSKCCGCTACVQICPKQCIAICADEEGFIYPEVDTQKCVNCSLCEKVCPYNNFNSPKKPLVCYAANNNDIKIRKQSSSGGVFTPIAEYVIAKGGVVFGAQFNNDWQVVHTYVDNKDYLGVFRGSKYVQSHIGESFKHAQKFLQEGRFVLFSGTPCQILGLKNFLRKQYSNLITIEIACHGVPSPKVWNDYLKSLNLSNIGMIYHRDKSTGWRDYSLSIKDIYNNILFIDKSYMNKYMMAFSLNFTLRPACFVCPAKAGKSGADITLADYWGIENFFPQLDDNLGTSFICCNSQIGEIIINDISCKLRMLRSDYQSALLYNPCIEKSTVRPLKWNQFWTDYNRLGINVIFSIKNRKSNILKRIIKRLLK